jgi:hypothetical protein
MTTNLEQLAALMAFTHQKAGVEGFRQVMDLILTERSSRATYELMSEVVDELKSTGLLAAAKDLDDLALEMLPHVWQMPCPEQPPHDRCWREEMEKKRKAWEAKTELIPTRAKLCGE